MRIAVDAMGGDYAPKSVIEGTIMASNELNAEFLLVGPEEYISKELNNFKKIPSSIKIVHASQYINMEESPLFALKNKKNSSLRVAFNLVKNGFADAVVSAGNSGAIMATAMYVLKKIDGVERPAIATILPTISGSTVILDVGANVDCKYFHLVQFAIMGEAYTESILGINKPRIALLSNGEEDSKGNGIIKETHEVLKKSSLNYIGYVEGKDIYNGVADVIVCDGFIGNIVLKTSEGVADTIIKMLKGDTHTWKSKIGLFLAKRAFKRLQKRIDYSEYGGAPLLGIDGIGIISHGRSSAKAIKNAILLSAKFVKNNLNKNLMEKLKDSVDLYSVCRKKAYFRQ
jgi:glycerol-3-phosphate acyltransferase PlsX